MTTLKDCCRHVFEFVTQQKLHPGYRASIVFSYVLKKIMPARIPLRVYSGYILKLDRNTIHVFYFLSNETKLFFWL